MKSIVLFLVCFSIAFIDRGTLAEKQCILSNCNIENNCACALPHSPINTEETPQFVTLTFDDSVTARLHDVYVNQLLSSRKNPDGNPVSATFYIPHQYTDYQKVNSLYNEGYDIGVNSISKDNADYFANAPTSLLVDEFEGQRIIISKFANIPMNDIRGARTPHFQLSGDKTFDAYNESGIEYDNSWTTFANEPLFPYTLNYKSDQRCYIGKCPTKSYPGFWVLPIINFIAEDGYQCNVLFSCKLNGSASDILNWLIQQYERNNAVHRAPLSFLVNSAWFELLPESLDALTQFLDYIQMDSATYLVSHAEVIRWAKNPVKLSQYKTIVPSRNASCYAKVCKLQFGEEEIRYMSSCSEACPNVYPWVGNPLGNS